MRKIFILFYCILCMGAGTLHAQTLRMVPDSYSVNSTVNDKTRLIAHYDAAGKPQGELLIYQEKNSSNSLDRKLFLKGHYKSGRLEDTVHVYNVDKVMINLFPGASEYWLRQNEKETCKDWLHIIGNVNGTMLWWNKKGDKPFVEVMERYADNKKEGLTEVFYADGKLKKQIMYHDDKKNGAFTYWFENGKVSEQGYFQEDKFTGIYSRYNEKGIMLQSRSCYYCPEGDIVKNYYQSGELKSTYLLNGYYYTGDRKEYFKSGTLSSYRHYTDGDQDSVEIHYFEDGSVKERMQYKNYQKNGLYESFYESNGNKRVVTSFVDGIPHGNYTEWYESGNLKHVGNYADGIANLSDWKYYDSTGTLLDKEPEVDLTQEFWDEEIPTVEEKADDPDTRYPALELPTMNIANPQAIAVDKKTAFVKNFPSGIRLKATVDSYGYVNYEILTQVSKKQAESLQFLFINNGLLKWNAFKVNGKSAGCVVYLTLVYNN